ncbi:MAG: hypothetical protein CW338_01795 [Clostridiales bacterium]|nr:hypothetical protein [Clostridiales bacterium]
MKNMKIKMHAARLLIMILTLAIAVPGFAFGAEQQLMINVNYMNDRGEYQQSLASCIGCSGYEQAYWAWVPYGTDLNALSLSIYDPTGTFVSYMPGDGEILQNVFDSGSSLEGAFPVTVFAFRADDYYGTQITLYISTETNMPAPAAAVSWPVTVTVHYCDEYGMPVASDTAEYVYNEGDSYIQAQPYDLYSGYVLMSSDTQSVYADQNGNVYPGEVTFTYTYVAPVEWPRPVTVHYCDEYGMPVASDSIAYAYAEGETYVLAQPADLYENYTLTSSDIITVYADSEGKVNPGEVTFTYTYVAPVEWPRSVTVHYCDEYGTPVANDTTAYVYNEGEAVIQAQPDGLYENYFITSADTAFVYADSEGNVNPGEVTFTYTYVAPVEWPRPVTVHYCDEYGMPVANDTTVYVYNEGEAVIQAQPDGLYENYYITSADTAFVYADSEGNVNPGEVTFTYTYVAPVEWPRPVTIHYCDEYGTPVANDTTAYVYNEGEAVIQAQPDGLYENYFITSADTAFVYADSEGKVNPGEVTFTYTYVAPVEWPRPVTVHYCDEYGMPVANDTTAYVYNEGEAVIQAQPDGLYENYFITSADTVNVYADSEGNVNPGEVTFTYTYVAPVEWPHPVTVHYCDEYGMPVANDTTAYVYNEGEAVIQAQPTDLYENYFITSADTVTVYADSEGNVNPGEVTFTYTYVAPVEWPRPVTVHYNDEYGMPVANDTTAYVYTEGENSIQAQPDGLYDNYYLMDEDTQTVYADSNGNVTPGEITFVYAYEAPVEWPKYVTVHYLSIDGLQIAGDTLFEVSHEGTFTIEPVPAELLINYELTGDVVYETVTADEDGNLDKTEVTFYYEFVSPVTWPKTVTVHYVSDTGEIIAPDGLIEVFEGFNRIIPETGKVPENYVLTGESEVSVMANSDGTLSRNEATFTYTYVAPVEWPKYVTVHYFSAASETQESVCVATDTWVEVYAGNTVITAEPSDLSPFYEPLEENASYTVYADEQGNLSESEVTFYYVYHEPVLWPRYVTVHYLSEDGLVSVAADQSREVNQGENQVWASPEGLMNDYVISGDECVTVYADADGNVSPEEITFKYRYVQPQSNWPVQIPVYHYIEESDDKVSADTSANIYQGNNEIKPLILDGYTCTEESVVVIGYEDGSLSQYEVNFLYYSTAPSEMQPGEEIIIAPVTVNVLFRSNDGVTVASPVSVVCQAGLNEIICNPYDLKDGYVLNDDSSKYVYVDANGASNYEVVFEYVSTVPEYIEEEVIPVQTPETVPEPVITPTPAPAAKWINIRYINAENGEVFMTDVACCETGVTTPVYADLQKVRNMTGSNMELVSSNPVIVSIDENGYCSVDEITFSFTAKKQVVSIFYRDENENDVASSQQIECADGANSIYARPYDLVDGYVLDVSRNGEEQLVYCIDGTITPTYVIFYYCLAEEPSEPMDTYARPKANTIRLFSEPVAKSEKQIAIVNSNDVMHVTEMITNRSGEVWYSVECNGIYGFVKTDWINFMTEDEISRYLATPVPVMPEGPISLSGEVINLWGTAKKQVNFREEPSTESKRIKGAESIDSKDKVWVMEMVPGKDGSSDWYRVIYKNKEGYVSAGYITLMSQEKSDEQQRRLNSPAPEMIVYVPYVTIAPTFTPVPVVTDTPEPATEAPATPVPTATPAPYQGYALIRYETLLRSDASFNDVNIITSLPQTTLVLITEQVWNGDVLWDFVDVQGQGIEGYVPDDVTHYIDSEEAGYYISRLRPTATPTAVPQEYSGFYRTLGYAAFRASADEQGYILNILDPGSVCYILAQEYPDGVEWELVQYGDTYGYIRGDQLIEMSNDEVQGFLMSLTTPTPSPVPVITTPEPDPLSCYAFVDCSGKLNIREKPSMNGTSVSLLGNYSLLMIIGSEYDSNGEEWYKVIVAEENNAASGYAKANYVHRLRTSEVDRFLCSEEYLSAHETIESAQQGNLSSYEDYNTVWQESSPANGPAITFAPWQTLAPAYQTEQEIITTPDPLTPPPAAFVTIIPTYTASPSTATPRPGNTPSAGNNTVENSEGNGMIWLIIIGVVLIVAGAGAAYAYSVHVKNEKRRAAIRAQQARKQNSVPVQPQSSRPGTGNTVQSGRPVNVNNAYPPAAPSQPANGTAVNTASGSTRAFPAQNTSVYRAGERYVPSSGANNGSASGNGMPQGDRSYYGMPQNPPPVNRESSVYNATQINTSSGADPVNGTYAVRVNPGENDSSSTQRFDRVSGTPAQAGKPYPEQNDSSSAGNRTEPGVRRRRSDTFKRDND